LGANFASFLTPLVVSVVVAVGYHSVWRYRFLDGIGACLATVGLGWIGGWLGSPVLGHWWWKIESVYTVPAILGAGVAIQLDVSCWKACAKLLSAGPSTRLGAVEEIRAKPAA
jgi:uncharacterized membrane protein YeaQ/YmgE (transglycosylase-associated protein family)